MKHSYDPRQQLFSFEFDRLYLFDNFYVSQGNETAYLALKKLCSEENVFSNSLFLFGESGCGKTHLLQALGNELAKSNPSLVIKLLPSRLVGAKFQKSSDEEVGIAELIRRYEGSDVLLVDDIEEFSFSTPGQDALFHLYNHFRENQKLFVATGNHSPSEISSLSPHLTTRLGWGTAIKMGTPTEEVRKKILKKLASDKNLRLEDKELDYILNHFPRDYRTIKKIVEAVDNYSLRTQRKATIPLIKEAFGTLAKL